MSGASLRIESLPGYAPTIGRLVCMLTYARATLVAAVSGLGPGELDHLHDAARNSIGALLAHAAAVARYYQLLSFEDREPSAEEEAAGKPRSNSASRSAGSCVAANCPGTWASWRRPGARRSPRCRVAATIGWRSRWSPSLR